MMMMMMTMAVLYMKVYQCAERGLLEKCKCIHVCSFAVALPERQAQRWAAATRARHSTGLALPNPATIISSSSKWINNHNHNNRHHNCKHHIAIRAATQTQRGKQPVLCVCCNFPHEVCALLGKRMEGNGQAKLKTSFVMDGGRSLI